FNTQVTYGVNLRSKPSTSSKVIRMLNRGEMIRVVSESGSNWLKVETKNGTTGYISANGKYTNYSGKSTSSPASPSVSPSRSALVKTAKSYVGDFKYKWGAEPWNT